MIARRPTLTTACVLAAMLAVAACQPAPGSAAGTATGATQPASTTAEAVRPTPPTGDQADASRAFLAENAKRPGIQVTASGLQYRIVRQGPPELRLATADDTVLVDYEGRFINGAIFDSSYERGQPISFPLRGVIPGWTEGLQLMRPGSEFEFFIPAELAYGAEPPAPDFPVNAALIFRVELRAIRGPDGQMVLQPDPLTP